MLYATDETMSTVRSRENTFKVDLSNFLKRPSFEEMHAFVYETIGLRLDQVLRLQMNHVQNCVHVKCIDLQTAQAAVEQHNEKHELVVNGKSVKVRLTMDDGGVEVKLHDLSENVSNVEIETFLKQFGEVVSIREMVWGPNFAFKGVSSGVRVAKMILRRHIKSFVTIQGEQTLISYRNQPQTCKHCTELSHPGSTCVQNKKLLGQKVDLNERLKKSQATPTASYARVLSSTSVPSSNLLPQFALTNLNALNEQERRSGADNSTDTQSNNDNAVSIPPMQKEQSTETTATHVCVNLETPMDQVTTEECETGEMEVAAVAAPSEQQLLSDAATSSGTVCDFKKPNNPTSLRHIPIEISESESGESSTENMFKKVKRAKGRSRKLRGVSPPFVAVSDVMDTRK